MHPSSRLILAAAASLLAGCAMRTSITHTPPGTSVELALAKKPELVKLPTPPASSATALAGHSGAGQLPAVEPPMPERGILTEQVAEAYSRGVFCLEAQREEEALASFEEVVKLDPTFTDAWEKMAAIYEKRGESKKAMDAIKKAKKLARK